jgi:hypothetical protein
MFNPDPTVGNGTTFCNSTTLTNPAYGAFPTGTYYIHYNFQYVQVSLTNGNNTVAVTSTCASCPTPTPTPTSTPTPTITSTPTVTPNPTSTPTVTPNPTSTPTVTPNPTSTPTVTPTPTATPFPTISAYFFTLEPTGYLACNGGTLIQVQLSAATFCGSNTYTSSYFTSLGTTTYWLAYDGNYVKIFHSGSSNQASRADSCQTCNTTAPTPTPVPPTPTPVPPTPTPVPTNTPEPTEPPVQNFEYTATNCNGTSIPSIVTSESLNVFSTYVIAGSAPQRLCYTIDSFVGYTSSGVTHYFSGLVTDCGDSSCVQL